MMIIIIIIIVILSDIYPGNSTHPKVVLGKSCIRSNRDLGMLIFVLICFKLKLSDLPFMFPANKTV